MYPCTEQIAPEKERWREATMTNRLRRISQYGLSAIIGILVLGSCAEAKTFRWANDGDANSMDPYARLETFLLAFDMSMYEPLLRRNREMKLEPGLAIEWRQTDPTTWRFKCGKGSNSMTARPSRPMMLSSPSTAQLIPAPILETHCRL